MASQNGTADSLLALPASRLDKLPEELREIIFKGLVPDPIPTGTRLPSADILGSRKALHSLCLTSKLSYATALPLLYKHVIITDYVQIASLLVTFITYPVRLKLMRNLSALVEFGEWGNKMEVAANWRQNSGFMEQTVSRLKENDPQSREADVFENVDTVEIFDIESIPTVEAFDFDSVKTIVSQLKDLMNCIPTELEESDGGFKYFLDQESWDWYENAVVDVYERLLQLLLLAQTDIEDILTTVPHGYGQSLCPEEMKKRIVGRFLSDPNQPVSENPFNNLRSIRKQAFPYWRELGSNRLDPLEPEYLESKEWESFQDPGYYSFRRYLDAQGYLWPRSFEPPGELIVFSHITALGLYKSRTHPALLRVMLSACKTLKSLAYTTNALDWTCEFVPLAATEEADEIPVPTLQQALDEVKDTLTDLYLGWYRTGRYSREHEAAALGPHRVDVSDFPRLTSSEIDPVFVRNDNDALDQPTQPDEV